LARFLEHGDQLDVICSSATAEDAVEAVGRLAPDLVTMDLELPGMGGLRAIEEIMRLHPVPVVVMSAHVERGSETAAAALAAGAVEALCKSQLRLDESDCAAAVALRHRLGRLAREHAESGTHASAAAPAPLKRDRSAHDPTVIGVCASTGGPNALVTLFAGLPAAFPTPVLVVQHMASGFMDPFVRALNERVPLPVAVAEDNMLLRRGIWFAPDDANLRLQSPTRLSVARDAAPGSRHPSADVLLESIAAVAREGAVGVVLTGMGRDGGNGVAAVSRAGGWVIAQDEETSVIFGMPRTAIEQGANVVLPLARIAHALCGLAPVEALA
jgi:two-component system chemotaxis response regulator CheB